MDGQGMGRRIMWVLWPSFLVAAAADGLFFSAVDPVEMHLFGGEVELSRQAIYTLGFFGFWATGILASAMAVFLNTSADEVNRKAAPGPGEEPGGRPAAGG